MSDRNRIPADEINTRAALEERSYTDYQTVVVWGSRYTSDEGDGWQMAVAFTGDAFFKSFRVLNGRLVEKVQAKYLEAALAAIKDWESNPA